MSELSVHALVSIELMKCSYYFTSPDVSVVSPHYSTSPDASVPSKHYSMGPAPILLWLMTTIMATLLALISLNTGLVNGE